MPVKPNFVFNFHLMVVVFLVFNKLTQTGSDVLFNIWTLILSFDVFDFTMLANTICRSNTHIQILRSLS